jgi:hypothetical protein
MFTPSATSLGGAASSMQMQLAHLLAFGLVGGPGPA